MVASAHRRALEYIYGLERGGVYDVYGVVGGMELFGEPFAGSRVAVGEHDASRFRSKGEV